MKINISPSSVYSFILLVAGFMLFWEWLRPLEQITETGSVYLFAIFTAVSFLASFLIRNHVAKFLVKFCTLLFILDYLFIAAPLFSSEWMQTILLEMRYNIANIFDNNWTSITSFFRSLLFLLLLWLMSYLLHYWFIIANKFFLFVLLTIIYLAVLDTFTVYNAEIPMIRTFVISFIMLGINRYIKLIEQVEGDKQKNRFYWMTTVVTVVGVVTMIGWFSPKLNPQWPDPVPFIQSTANHVGFENTSVQKVGYGEDDSQLGGSFVQDDSKVFEAITPKNGYWRIESKDLYTGKGWERSTDQDFQRLVEGEVNWRTFPRDRTDTMSHEAVIQPDARNPLSKVVYPYGVSTISSSAGVNYFMDNTSGMIEMEAAEQNLPTSYTVSYEEPSFSINELRNNSDQDPTEIQEQYLQLPDQLPERVHQLSADIVDGLDTRYDKAKAVEGYFSANGYTYQTEDVSIPEEGEDYVDQFLFEERVGYCDNFSTSMVVMLRSLDIPARWAKGFTGGSMSQPQPESLPGEYGLYEVTNNNAHSWVEVYFPESGWVPFEPTSGFTNPTDFYQETSSDFGDEETTTEETEVEQEEQEGSLEEETAEQEMEEDESAAQAEQTEKNNKTWMYVIILIVILTVILSFVVYRKRHQIRDWYARKKWENKRNTVEIETGYLFLLELLDKRGYKRKQGQTLRHYAKEVDEALGTTNMYDVTILYEQYVYNQKTEHIDAKQLRLLIDPIIDKILS